MDTKNNKTQTDGGNVNIIQIYGKSRSGRRRLRTLRIQQRELKYRHDRRESIRIMNKFNCSRENGAKQHKRKQNPENKKT